MRACRLRVSNASLMMTAQNGEGKQLLPHKKSKQTQKQRRNARALNVFQEIHTKLQLCKPSNVQHDIAELLCTLRRLTRE